MARSVIRQLLMALFSHKAIFKKDEIFVSCRGIDPFNLSHPTFPILFIEN